MRADVAASSTELTGGLAGWYAKMAATPHMAEPAGSGSLDDVHAKH